MLDAVQRYYSEKVAEHGPTARGVDWNDAASQELRFEQLLEVCEPAKPFRLNDYGCGYGALAAYLEQRDYDFTYTGFDISADMVEQARELLRDSARCRFVVDDSDLEQADYTVASGIFNVKLDAVRGAWEQHALDTLSRLNELSALGFAFNMLTSYSDADRMRDDLYYADPLVIFDHCKRNFSRGVALLHDYGLYEFTIIVRRDTV